MATRLLLLAAVCSLATCQTSRLVIYGSTTHVEMDEGKDPEPKYILKKLYTIKIQCTMFALDNSVLTEPSIMWRKAGSSDPLDSRYSNESSHSEDKRNFTSTLRLSKPNNEHIDNYTCTGAAKGLNGSTGIAQMQSRPLISFTIGGEKGRVSDVALWPGDSVNIRCIVEGNPTGSVEWFKETNGSIVVLANSSLLNLTDLSYERDRGFVSCRSRNAFGENSAKIFLRVKHPQAYLPPLIIIIVEVIIIAIVVAVYELYMRRKRSKLESDAGTAYKTD